MNPILPMTIISLIAAGNLFLGYALNGYLERKREQAQGQETDGAPQSDQISS